MATETYKHDGVDWRLITDIQYTDDTLTDRSLTEMWYNDAGNWLKVFDKIASNAVSLVGRTITGTRNTSGGIGTAKSGYELTTDGIAQQLKNTSSGTDSLTLSDLSGNDWWTGKPQVAIGSDYEVMATQISSSGAGSLVGTVGVWTLISSFQLWTWEVTGNNVEVFTTTDLLIEIRDLATSTLQDSATITLNANLFGP